MNFVVTGGAGFVGCHLVSHLIKEGHSVTVIDNLSRGNIQNLAEVKNHIEFHRIDICDCDELKRVLKNTEGVFHQAALTCVQESFTNQDEYYNVNVKGTENILKLAKEFDFKLVFASSSSVYGDTLKIPVKEQYDRNPINPYGKTKLEDELLAEKFAKMGTKVIGLRYFNIYGRGQNRSYAGVITKFLDNISNSNSPVIFGDGSQIRDFIFVEDVAKANLSAMLSDLDFGLINIGSGSGTTIIELANMIITASGLTIKPTFAEQLEGDIKKSIAYVELAEKLLKWQSQKKLKDWLNETISSTEIKVKD